MFFFARSGRTSPSTQEAIAGMLSISQTYVQPSRGHNQRKYASSSSPLPEDDTLNNVHQDEDYSKSYTTYTTLYVVPEKMLILHYLCFGIYLLIMIEIL